MSIPEVKSIKFLVQTDQALGLVPSLTATTAVAEALAKFLDVRGILLGYIDGFILRDLEEHAPRESWQTVCDEAIRVYLEVSKPGLLNEDCCVRNFQVRKNANDDSYEVFQIDFALCYERNPEQSDESWILEKCEQDDEGAIGTVMQCRLKGGYVYTPTKTYWVYRGLTKEKEQQLEEWRQKRAEEEEAKKNEAEEKKL
ncbi:MAG: hypothetical protein MMC33_005842 [Icmadophila ericetorum]|nr:hypothetical protein [Icmadophila ericetorum]